MTQRDLNFDLPGVKIGTAEYEAGPTGCTVFIFHERVLATVDVRGGDPAVSEYQYSNYDAICFAGGAMEQAGQGGAFRQFGQVKVAVFTVVNAFGDVFDREGQLVRGNLDLDTGERRSKGSAIQQILAGDLRPPPSKGNTTLTLVVTNQALTPWALKQIARQVHSSMARAIRPFHTLYDGDILYMVTTATIDDQRVDPVTLGIVAAEVAWDAILASCD